MTDLTKASEAREELTRRMVVDICCYRLRSEADVRERLAAYAEAVRSDTLADVAARLPEALRAECLHPENGEWPCSGAHAYHAAAILAHLTGGTDR